MLGGGFHGVLSITWNEASSPWYVPLFGHRVELHDRKTGEPVTSALELEIHVDPAATVTATVTHLVDEEDNPLAPGADPVWEGEGEEAHARTASKVWLVGEMKTAPIQGRPEQQEENDA